MRHIKKVKEEYPFGLSKNEWVVVQHNVENQIIANQRAFAKIKAQKKQPFKNSSISI